MSQTVQINGEFSYSSFFTVSGDRSRSIASHRGLSSLRTLRSSTAPGMSREFLLQEPLETLRNQLIFQLISPCKICFWLVVGNNNPNWLYDIFIYIFQRGWNHQPGFVSCFFWQKWSWNQQPGAGSIHQMVTQSLLSRYVNRCNTKTPLKIGRHAFPSGFLNFKPTIESQVLENCRGNSGWFPPFAFFLWFRSAGGEHWHLLEPLLAREPVEEDSDPDDVLQRHRGHCLGLCRSRGSVVDCWNWWKF